MNHRWTVGPNPNSIPKSITKKIHRKNSQCPRNRKEGIKNTTIIKKTVYLKGLYCPSEEII
jgi:hypothetical protein